jgi:hypothetical protein
VERATMDKGKEVLEANEVKAFYSMMESYRKKIDVYKSISENFKNDGALEISRDFSNLAGIYEEMFKSMKSLDDLIKEARETL